MLIKREFNLRVQSTGNDLNDLEAGAPAAPRDSRGRCGGAEDNWSSSSQVLQVTLRALPHSSGSRSTFFLCLRLMPEASMRRCSLCSFSRERCGDTGGYPHARWRRRRCI